MQELFVFQIFPPSSIFSEGRSLDVMVGPGGKEELLKDVNGRSEDIVPPPATNCDVKLECFPSPHGLICPN